MAELRRKLILTGCRAGTTCVLRKMRFVNGELTLSGADNEVESLTKYMGRSYQAFPQGSPELAHYQRLDREAANGASKTDAGPGPTDQVGKVPSAVQPTGAGSTPAAADNVGGAAETQPGSTEQRPSGDGQQGAGPDSDPGSKHTLQQVILQLDPTNDELWTAQGYPRCDAVAAACGREDITRKDVEGAAPGFMRPAQQ